MSLYSFSIFEDAGISPQSSAVFFGVENNFLPPVSTSQYEEWAVTNLGIEGKDTLLVPCNDKYEALNEFKEAGYSDDGTGRDILRYAVLASLSSQGETLLHDIEEVYADFDYPGDMEPFIYYMPCSERNASSQALLVRFKKFLQEEKTRLGL